MMNNFFKTQQNFKKEIIKNINVDYIKKNNLKNENLFTTNFEQGLINKLIKNLKHEKLFTTNFEQCLINKLIKNINVVYKYSYKNGEKVTGFGDFIRGCYFLQQFTDRVNKRFDISICNHELSNYLEYFNLKKTIEPYILIEIPFYKNDNYKYNDNNNIITYEYFDIDSNLINYINNLENYDGDVYLYLINHPCEQKITQSHKEKIKEIIKPTDEVNHIIYNALNKLELIKQKYKIIHLRMDDSNFYTNDIKQKQILFLINHINILLQKIDDDIFLISSSNYIKSIIIKKFPKIKTIFNEITHIADKNLNNKSNLLNTLKDFYIMSHSNKIYSFSVYHHGSGFSKWCSVTYNIPYVCYKIPS